MPAAKYALYAPLLGLVATRYAPIKAKGTVVVNLLTFLAFIFAYCLKTQKLFYPLGIEQNIFLIYVVIFSTIVCFFRDQSKEKILSFFAGLFLILSFSLSEIIIFFPLVRIFLDYMLLQYESVEKKHADIFLYRLIANICETALLYMVMGYELNKNIPHVLSLAVFFMFIIQMLLSYFSERCLNESISPLRILSNFTNYFLYPGWMLMFMREMKFTESLTSASVYGLIAAMLVVLVDMYLNKRSFYALIVANILLFLCPTSGSEYIFYKIGTYSFIVALMLLWSGEMLALSPLQSRWGKILKYIFLLFIALPILGNGNLTKCIILLRLHSEYLPIYLIILVTFMAMQTFFKSEWFSCNPKVLIKNFKPFWIIIVINMLITIAMNFSLLFDAKI